MAVRVQRSEPATIQRIQRAQREQRPARQPRPNRAAMSAVREVVHQSKSAADAISAVKAIDAAWADASTATHDATRLLIAILELSDTVEEALAAWGMLRNDGALLKPLTAIRTFVQAEFPDASMRIVPGDEVASAYLDVRIPTSDYPSFWDAHVRLRDWIIKEFPHLDSVIHTSAMPAAAHV